MNPIAKYTKWLHTRWPAGTIEKLPVTGDDGETNVPGLRVAGDLTGIPLLKFSADTGVRAVRAFASEGGFRPGEEGDGALDLAIIGGGVSGMAAAIEARRQGWNFRVFEAREDFSTIRNFPKAKPIYTYPTDMEPAGEMHFRAEVKEDLLAELEEQRREAESSRNRCGSIRSGKGVTDSSWRWAGAKRSAPAGCWWPSAAAATTGRWGFRARKRTRSSTDFTTRRIIARKRFSSSGEAIARRRRPSPSPSAGRRSPWPTGGRR